MKKDRIDEYDYRIKVEEEN